ncbi:MAG: acyl carrier protein [Ruminococcus sp.]|nr:acyl carrier protein [Ruminococcus sp.]MBR1393935.1 acyl carrier protein [Ruminococcus sp.]
MEEILEILSEIHPDVDFENEEGLADRRIIDSLDIVTIVSEIADRLDVVIPAEEIIPENFNSVKALSELVRRLDEE